MPPVLFEGDRSAPPRPSGPGERIAFGGNPTAYATATETGELPEAYGTGRLFLTTRDPHWIYAHWDLSREQQRRCNANSIHGHLILRTYVDLPQGPPISEIHVHPESRHWFVHVERAATSYITELGYYQRGDKWARVATSAATLTPPDTISAAAKASFATIPVNTPFEKLLHIARHGRREHVPLALALEELRQLGEPELSAGVATHAPDWTPEQERALAEVLRADTSPCAWMDSLEISELMQGGEQVEISSLGAPEFGLHAWSPGGEEAVFSPTAGPAPGAKGFWFSVNAELVIHGATERDATVTIGGRTIVLRPDGSFSARFALPDGQHELTMDAVSADGTDVRAAELKFTRTTKSLGGVGPHPQDPTLKPPTPENG
jgi:hypothetical protein